VDQDGESGAAACRCVTGCLHPCGRTRSIRRQGPVAESRPRSKRKTVTRWLQFAAAAQRLPVSSSETSAQAERRNRCGGARAIRAVTVQPGNTLWPRARLNRELRRRHPVFVRLLRGPIANRIRNPDLIYPGRYFEIPRIGPESAVYLAKGLCSRLRHALLATNRLAGDWERIGPHAYGYWWTQGGYFPREAGYDNAAWSHLLSQMVLHGSDRKLRADRETNVTYAAAALC